MQVNVSIAQRTSYAILHIRGAASLASDALVLEGGFAVGDPVPPGVRERAQADVVGAIMMAVASIEAAGNEVFLDCLDDTRAERFRAVGPAIRVAVAADWPNAERDQPLGKLQRLLGLFGQQALDAGAQPFQDAAALVRLRNALVHARTEWVVTATDMPGQQPDVQHMERMLGRKFAESPLYGPGNAFFPDRALSGGCARWAVRSAVAVMDEFFQRIGVLPYYDHIRGDLP